MNLTKQQLLDLLMLLSAIESWSFASSTKMPDYLYDKITESVEVLAKELLG